AAVSASAAAAMDGAGRDREPDAPLGGRARSKKHLPHATQRPEDALSANVAGLANWGCLLPRHWTGGRAHHRHARLRPLVRGLLERMAWNAWCVTRNHCGSLCGHLDQRLVEWLARAPAPIPP